MSKAMDALELIYSTDKARHLCSIKSKCAGCGELHKAFALLRDYITTTEADDPKKWYSNASWIAYQEKAKQLAARIKELEEALAKKDAALDVAYPAMKTRRTMISEPAQRILCKVMNAEDAQVEAALSGARKVGA